MLAERLHRPQIRPPRYDPWLDLREHWPDITVILCPMRGSLLGWVRYPVIALRAGTSSGQRRCTLTHEIVHLERGVADCGRREERYVHAEVARRLIVIEDLANVIRFAGGTHDPSAVAAALDVDQETLELRLGLLTDAERALIQSPGVRELWSVA